MRTSEALDAKGVTTNATKKAGMPVALPKLPTASTWFLFLLLTHREREREGGRERERAGEREREGE